MEVRATPERTAFELAGHSIRLSGQNERAVVSGQRGLITDDVRTAALVDEFNRRFDSIRNEYPVHRALKAVYRAAAVAEILRRHADGSGIADLMDRFTVIASEPDIGPVPTSIDSNLRTPPRGGTSEDGVFGLCIRRQHTAFVTSPAKHGRGESQFSERL